LGAAAVAVGYTVYTSDYYSQRQLNQFTPETLDEQTSEEIHRQIRNVAKMCIHHKQIEKFIMSSPAYSALRKAVYSEDKYVRLLALRALASLSRNSRDVRKRIAQTMDFTRLASEIYGKDGAKKIIASDGPLASALASKYLRISSEDLEKELSVSDMDDLLVYAFEDIVSSVAFHTDSHPKLLQLNYAERAAALTKSPCFHVRVTAIRAVGGLTRTVEGRQALAKTDVFPTLYNMVYPEETRDKLFRTETVNLATYAMQQLLLSESALDIMLPRYEKFFLAMTQSAKEDLLMKFDLQDDTDLAKGIVIAKQIGLGFGFGAIWGGLRSLLVSEWVPGIKRPQVRLSSLRKVIIGAANGSTGAIPLISLAILLNQINDSFLLQFMDSKATYGAAVLSLTGALAAVSGLSLQIFPFGLVPAFLGVNADRILAYIPGTVENERLLARHARRGTPDSDE
jgi:hypothetical protein